jgi:hypothetical protein
MSRADEIEKALVFAEGDYRIPPRFFFVVREKDERLHIAFEAAFDRSRLTFRQVVLRAGAGTAGLEASDPRFSQELDRFRELASGFVAFKVRTARGGGLQIIPARQDKGPGAHGVEGWFDAYQEAVKALPPQRSGGD